MESNKKNKKSPVLFSTINYILLIISFLIVCLGFIFMIGGGGETPTEYNHEIFSFRRIKLAPIIVIMGYIGMIGSIFYNDRRN